MRNVLPVIGLVLLLGLQAAQARRENKYRRRTLERSRAAKMAPLVPIPNHAPACRQAKANLHNLQTEQNRLLDKERPLIILQQDFDQALARLTMLKGMRNLNQEYLAILAGAGKPIKMAQIDAAKAQLSKHQQAIERVHVAKNILQTFIQKEHLRKKLVYALENHKVPSDILKEFNFPDSAFAKRLVASIPHTLYDGFDRYECNENIRCLERKAAQMAERYQDVLLAGLDEEASLPVTFGSAQAKQVQECSAPADCDRAFKDYRAQVAKLSRVAGKKVAWKQVQEFEAGMKNLNVDPTEQSRTQFNRARKRLLKDLASSATMRRRNRMRMGFKENNIQDLFGTSRTTKQAAEFNDLLAKLKDAEQATCQESSCQIAKLDGRGDLKVDQKALLNFFENISEEQRKKWAQNLQTEIEQAREQLALAKKAISRLKKSREYQEMERLKNYAHHKILKLCRHKKEFQFQEVPYGCATGKQKQVSMLADQTGQVVALISQKETKETLASIHHLCKNTKSDKTSVRQSCDMVNRDHSPISPVEKLIKSRKDVTPIYDERGHLVRVERHTPGWQYALIGAARALPTHMDTIGLWATQSTFKEYLADQVLIGKQMKSYQHNQQQLEEVWMEHWLTGAPIPNEVWQFYGNTYPTPMMPL